MPIANIHLKFDSDLNFTNLNQIIQLSSYFNIDNFMSLIGF